MVTTELAAAAPLPSRPPRRRLSVVRVLLVLVVVAAAVTWFSGGFRSGGSTASAGPGDSWFAPYVDVTATPQYGFEDPSVAARTSAVLGFVVSSPAAACQPSWGGAYPLAAAGDQLDLDRRIARLKQLGGQVAVSFGGAANSELAIGCVDVAQLTAAYRAVIDRYSAGVIDFDIEGATASAAAVSARRAAAVAAAVLQESATGHDIAVWVTLPVGPSGLTAEGLTVLSTLLAAKVPLAGVNGMTMDYGVPLPAGRSMADEGELALTALQGQIRSAYATAGRKLTDGQVWQLVGATAMIGQNDIAAEVFTLDDARRLVDFANAHGMRRLSMWSANRDQGCGPNYPDVQIVSDACSGVPQDAGAYSAIFQTFGPVTAVASADPTTTAARSSAATGTVAAPVDDPATSPYPIWNINQAYPKDTKIVWHRNVYQAKWYSQGDQPDAPVASADQTPWTLIGPVLPGEHPVPTPTVKVGTYPEWNATTAYPGGSRVMLDGVGYQAKWWSQGEPPGRSPTSPSDVSPWQLITSS